jgi:hypothetical protein
VGGDLLRGEGGRAWAGGDRTGGCDASTPDTGGSDTTGHWPPLRLAGAAGLGITGSLDHWIPTVRLYGTAVRYTALLYSRTAMTTSTARLRARSPAGSLLRTRLPKFTAVPLGGLRSDRLTCTTILIVL